jgi:predicted RNA-binding Zn-ribbon protein involved in translation (DUF1610 family)
MKYTKEILESATKDCTSIAQVLRKLDLKENGGTHSYISEKIRKFGIDTSHFLGQAINRGKISNRRKDVKDILIYKDDRRIKSHQLTRAMVESGVAQVCKECGTGTLYNDKKLTLHVDHISGNWRDNSLENLRFLCPNCHSQTDNFGSKNIAQ